MRWIAFLCFLLVANSVFVHADENATLKAGAAAVNIDPVAFPINMPGGFGANMATRVHDSFHSRAIVLDDGKTAIALVVVDNLGVDPSLIAEAKSVASQKTGIPTNRMMICSTHTHSGPPSTLESYRDLLVDGMATSIANAHAQRQPASVGAASHPLPDEVFNRRWYLQPGKMPINPFGETDQVKMNPSRSPGILDRPAGPTDPDISVISIQDAKKRPLALFANYSLHYVGAIPKGTLSSDYFGEFARLMPTRLRTGKQFVAMMSNGTSGDINNIPFGKIRPPREAFEQVRIVARKAADTAWTADQKIEERQRDVSIEMVQREVNLTYRRPTKEQEERARKIVALKDEKEIAALPKLAMIYAKRTLKAADRNEDSVDVILQVIRIGDVAVCAIPFEILVEIGLELKDTSPFEQTIVVGLANGRHGYLPTPRQHRLGGYETWLGTNYVQKDASDILVKHLKEMLDELSSR